MKNNKKSLFGIDGKFIVFLAIPEMSLEQTKASYSTWTTNGRKTKNSLHTALTRDPARFAYL